MRHAGALGAQLLRLVLLPLAFLAAPALAFAQAVLVLESQPGDTIGEGLTRTFTTADGTFTATPVSRGLSFHFNGGAVQWTGQFHPPRDEPVVAGEYPFANTQVSGSESQPVLEFFSPTRNCASVSGRFSIFELVYAGSSIQSLAIDFEQHCNGAGPALIGRLRYNSAVPMSPAFPSVAAFGTRYLETGETATLDGQMSRDPGGTALAFSWTQLFGPAATLASPSAATTTFVAPQVPTGGADLVFELRVTNAGGQARTRNVTVHVANPADPKTFFYLKSEPGDSVGRGMESIAFPKAGVNLYSGLETYPTPGVVMNYVRDNEWRWSAKLNSPTGEPLAVGEYPIAGGQPLGPDRAAINISTDRYCSSPSGRFIVWEYEATNNTVQKFAADFEQHCNGATPALLGSVRLNSSVPRTAVKPIAVAKAPAIAEVGEAITLNGTGSRDPQGGVLTYQWTQVSGPAAAITTPNAASASFVAPAVATGGRGPRVRAARDLGQWPVRDRARHRARVQRNRPAHVPLLPQPAG